MSPARVTVFRIARETRHYRATDISGAGAARDGGRWNAPDIPMVYASTNRALAAMETLVHAREARGNTLPVDRYLVEISILADAWAARTTFKPRGHAGWDRLPSSDVAMQWGSAWARAKASLIAVVPSVIVPEEANVIINPRHPAARKLRVRAVRVWTYDPRLGAHVVPAAMT